MEKTLEINSLEECWQITKENSNTKIKEDIKKEVLKSCKDKDKKISSLETIDLSALCIDLSEFYEFTLENVKGLCLYAIHKITADSFVNFFNKTQINQNLEEIYLEQIPQKVFNELNDFPVCKKVKGIEIEYQSFESTECFCNFLKKFPKVESINCESIQFRIEEEPIILNINFNKNKCEVEESPFHKKFFEKHSMKDSFYKNNKQIIEKEIKTIEDKIKSILNLDEKEKNSFVGINL